MNIILSIVIINGFVIMVYTDVYCEENYNVVISVSDYCFLSIYILEIALKWGHGFLLFWNDYWNCFDFVLVALSVLSTLYNEGLSVKNDDIARVFRMLRALRFFRVLGAVRALQVCFNTFLKCVIELANILLITVIMMFIFAVLGVQQFKTISPQDFSAPEVAFLTLFILITQDGWVDVYARMNKSYVNQLRLTGVDPNTPFSIGIVYMMLFIMIGAWIFMNVISGVAVTNWQLYVNDMKRETKQKYHSIDRSEEKYKEPVATTIGVESIDPSVWEQQRPYEVVDPKKLSVTKLENYYCVLLALEDNINEYLRLKDDLMAVFTDLCEINDTEDYDDAINEEDEDEDAGDVMSALITGNVANIKKANRLVGENTKGEVPPPKLSNASGISGGIKDLRSSIESFMGFG
jgi:cation channel sperm-associated protein 4